MNARPWKIILLLVGIFLAGGVTGGVLALRFAPSAQPKRTMPEQWGPARLDLLKRRLELTPAQIEQLRPIVRRDVEELNRLRQQSMGETRRVLERMERDIAGLLTPEQQEKFERLNAEMRARVQRQWEQRRGEGLRRRDRPPGEGPGGPPRDRPPSDAPAMPPRDRPPAPGGG